MRDAFDLGCFIACAVAGAGVGLAVAAFAVGCAILLIKQMAGV